MNITSISSLNTPLRIGTRGSPLALYQANFVKQALLNHYPSLTVEIVTVKTTGDIHSEAHLASIGGKGLFIKEIEEQLLTKHIDIAVHSLKDLPGYIAPECEIVCILEREDPSDLFISAHYPDLHHLPLKSKIGTSSPRRAAQLLHLRPDVSIIPFRGNVGTRLHKLTQGEVDATFLALAGVKRLGVWDKHLMSVVALNDMVPAVGQGAIGIEILKTRTNLLPILAPLHHIKTAICVEAERHFLRYFETGSCLTPIAALAQYQDDQHILITGMIASPNGKCLYRKSSVTTAENLLTTTDKLAQILSAQAGGHLFDERL